MTAVAEPKRAARRALFVVHSMTRGGAERVVSRLLAVLAVGHDADAYAVAVLEPGAEYPVPPGVRIHVLGSAQRGLPSKVLGGVRAFVRLARLVRRERPDAVVSFMPRSNALNLLGRRCSRRWPRCVVSERVAVRENYRGLVGVLTRWLIRRWYRRADTVVAVSQGLGDELRGLGVPADRIVVIPNPIDMEAIAEQARLGEALPGPEGPGPLLVSAGRLAPQKGYPVLLEALAIVRRTRPARLVVLGDGPQRRDLDRESYRLGVGGAVVWAGRVANPFPTMARADVFVLPSLWEGFPNALLEAMALGKAVVAADCPWGPAELLGGGRYGILVPRGDPQALAAALDRLLSDEELRRSYGARARARAAEFAASAVAARYVAAIRGRP